MSYSTGNRLRGWRDQAMQAAIRTRLSLAPDDRGDVPGWVLVSVMTAGLTTAVWLIADEQLTGILDRAMSTVSTP